MIKKLVLSGVVLACLTVSTTALAETTIWTVSCDATKKVSKIRVIADHREQARAMVYKQMKSTYCSGTLSIEKVELEKK